MLSGQHARKRLIGRPLARIVCGCAVAACQPPAARCQEVQQGVEAAAPAPASAVGTYAAVFAAHGGGDYAGVRGQVESMRIDDPPTASQLRCVYLAADSLYQLGEYSEAARYLQFWVSRYAAAGDPSLAQLLPYVRFRAAQAAQRLGEAEKARGQLESLHATPLDPPLQAAVALQLGWLAADRPEEHGIALEYCRAAAAAAAPGSRDSLSSGLLAGVLAAGSGDDDAAAELLAAVVGECGDAKAHEAVAFKGSLLLTQIANRRGRRVEDEGLCERLLSPPAGCEHLAEAAKLQAGLYAAANGDAAKAIPLLDSLLAAETASDDARAAAAIALLRLPASAIGPRERIRWAEATLAAGGLPAEPRLEAAVRLAEALSAEGRADEAIDRLAAAISQAEAEAADDRSPFARRGRLTLAELQFLQQRFSEAVELYDRLSADPDAQTACLAKLRLGEIAALQNRWADAARSVEELAGLPSLFDHAAAAEYLRGRVFAAQGRFEEARERLRSAVSLAGEGGGESEEVAARAAWLIGETHFLQGRYDLALAAYEQVSRFGSQRQWCAAALLQGGKCCELAGDWASAASRYRDLIERYPDSIYRPQADERLTQADTLAGPQVARQREEGANLR